MKVQLAVYTATEGFDWQPGSSYQRADLKKYHAMIGSFPDILLDEIPYGGVFVCDGRVVFYRFLVFERGDSRGRDALYCVLGTLSFDEMRKVDLAKILASRPFSRPHKPFPTEVDVEEGPVGLEEPKSLEDLERGLHSFRSAGDIGYYATFFPQGKFFCRMNGNREHPELKLDYSESCFSSRQERNPPPQPEVPSPSPGPRQPKQEAPGSMAGGIKPLPSRDITDIALWVLSLFLVLTIAALVLALIVMYRGHTGKQERSPNVQQVQEVVAQDVAIVTNETQKVVPQESLEQVDQHSPKPVSYETQLSEPSPVSRQCLQCGGSGKFQRTHLEKKCAPPQECDVCHGEKSLKCKCCEGRKSIAKKGQIEPCPECHSTGRIQCEKCKGKGCLEGGEQEYPVTEFVECSGCHGTGSIQVKQKLCPVCKGTTKIHACLICNNVNRHNELRNGKWVLCDEKGEQVSTEPCGQCGGKKIVNTCKYCDNKKYVDDAEMTQDAVQGDSQKAKGAK